MKSFNPPTPTPSRQSLYSWARDSFFFFFFFTEHEHSTLHQTYKYGHLSAWWTSSEIKKTKQISTPLPLCCCCLPFLSHTCACMCACVDHVCMTARICLCVCCSACTTIAHQSLSLFSAGCFRDSVSVTADLLILQRRKTSRCDRGRTNTCSMGRIQLFTV